MKSVILNKFLNFFYPHLCLQCSKKLKKNYFYFCKECLSFFYYLEPNPFLNYFAVFENEAPILTFLSQLKQQKLFSVSKNIAAFMVIQHFRLKWDLPDVIVPMTNSRLLNNYIFDLSKEVSAIIKTLSF